MEEIWKDIKGYEGLYRVSNLGRVKSLKRVVYRSNGHLKTVRERILKAGIDGCGYLIVRLSKDGKGKTFAVHKLVAMVFLNHTPCGHKMVVNHIDNDPANNRVSNLEIISQRENVFTHHIGTSKYKGVCWNKNLNKWMAQINFNGKNIYLGIFENELNAHNAYQNKLKEIIN